MDVDRTKIDLRISDLILADAVILEPLTDVDGIGFSVTYPDEITRQGFSGFYLVDNGEPPSRIDGSDIRAFEQTAFSLGVPLIVKPHSKWFTKGGDVDEDT